MKRLIISALAAMLCLCSGVRALETKLSLEQCETQALVNSPEVAASAAQYSAAVAAASATVSAVLPTLNLEGSAYYQGTVIEMQMPGRTIRTGDNWNLAVGPALYVPLYDFGARRLGARAAGAAALARKFELEAAKRSALLAVRTAYFNVVLAAEQNYLAGQYLGLALEQYADTEKRAAAGEKTRIDVLQFRQEVFARRKRYILAGKALGEALNGLFSLTGAFPPDTANPADARLAALKLDGVEPPTALIASDGFEILDTRLSPAEKKQLTQANPSLQSAAYLKRSAELAARQLNAQRWLDIQFYAKAQANYPKGPVENMFNQNIAGINISMPLWEYGRKQSLSAQQEHFAEAYDRKYAAANRDIKRGWKNALEGLAFLRRELLTDTEAQREAGELAELVYKSYSAGAAQYLEVQAANVRALNAASETALTRAQILLQLAVLDSLAETPDN